MKPRKIILLSILSVLVLNALTVYATKNILSLSVFYDNKKTKLTSNTIQDALDELYTDFLIDTCYTTNKTKYSESILNGTDPILGSGMIPVTIDKNGKVTYANINSKWYEYGNKEWANAVTLVDNPSKSYKVCDEISNDDIKGYFVWIPRYKYKIWDTGNYNSFYILSTLTDSTTDTVSSLRNIANKARTIEVVFENKTTSVSSGTTVGSYLTHPAFTSFNVNGLWVGKFETTGTISNPTVKPSELAIVNQTINSFWNSLYNFSRSNDSHMMKNTEWGAAAYLSHSKYGINKEIRINNNSVYRTGYGSVASANQTTQNGISGTTDDITRPWNTIEGKSASTTGNITGVYDMSGGTYEYMASYLSGYGVKNSNNIESGFSGDPVTIKGAKYFDVYNNSLNKDYSYGDRKLGDATGEMGPFYAYYDKDGHQRFHNAWYFDVSYCIGTVNPWVHRGGAMYIGSGAGQFYFARDTGEALPHFGSRLVLAPQ